MLSLMRVSKIDTNAMKIHTNCNVVILSPPPHLPHKIRLNCDFATIQALRHSKRATASRTYPTQVLYNDQSDCKYGENFS